MICPKCQRETARLIYDRHGKRCPACNDPTHIEIMDQSANGFGLPGTRSRRRLKAFAA